MNDGALSFHILRKRVPFLLGFPNVLRRGRDDETQTFIRERRQEFQAVSGEHHCSLLRRINTGNFDLITQQHGATVESLWGEEQGTRGCLIVRVSRRSRRSGPRLRRSGHVRSLPEGPEGHRVGRGAGRDGSGWRSGFEPFSKSHGGFLRLAQTVEGNRGVRHIAGTRATEAIEGGDQRAGRRSW